MELSELEQHVFAYYVANAANKLNMVGRFWPYGELTLLVEDKVQLSVMSYGIKARMACPKAARAFVDLQIARGGFSNVKNEFGGTMHQFQAQAYRDCVQALRETDPIIRKAETHGPDYWDKAFAALSEGAPPPSA